MRLEATPEEAEYGAKLWTIMCQLEGTPYLLAYSELFPGHHGADTLIPHYEILNDRTNRELLKLLYENQQNGKMSLDNIVAELSIKPDEVRSRIEFFRNNGMRNNVSLI